MATGRGLISVKTPGRQRDRRGRYTSTPYAELVRANQRMAERVQGFAVQNLVQNPWRRPNVTTGRLIRVTADPRNRFVAADGTGWAVGVRSYLDNSVAKYWRTIEEGSAATWPGGMRGLRIYGRWGGNVSGWYTNRWGPQPKATGPWSPRDGGRGKLRGINHAVSEARGLSFVTVKREIQGIQYYSRAWDQAEVNAVSRKQVRDLLRAVMDFDYGHPGDFYS